MKDQVKVFKRNLDGQVTWQYEARVLKREQNLVVLEAFFNREDMPFMDIVLKRDDRFVETFYSDRWYNIFEIYDRDDSQFKGWYCNIGYPAVINSDTVSYIDLSLDLWVSPEGTQTVLDQDEFLEMSLDVLTRTQALVALEELRERFRKYSTPSGKRDGAE